MPKIEENNQLGTANIADDLVLATVLNMNIVVTRLDKEHIDVRDTAGIRLMLLNLTDNKGLFTYFDTRLLQSGSQPEKDLQPSLVSAPLLTDQDIEEYIWEEISIPLNQTDIDNYSDGYIQYLNAVNWAKWGRDNSNGL